MVDALGQGQESLHLEAELGYSRPANAGDAVAPAAAASTAAGTGCTTNAAVSQRATTVERSRFRQHQDVRWRRRSLLILAVEERHLARARKPAENCTACWPGWSKLYANCSRRTLARLMFRVQRDFMYPKAVNDVSQVKVVIMQWDEKLKQNDDRAWRRREGSRSVENVGVAGNMS